MVMIVVAEVGMIVEIGTKDRHKVLVPIEVLLAIKDIMVGSGMLQLVGRRAWLVCRKGSIMVGRVDTHHLVGWLR